MLENSRIAIFGGRGFLGQWLVSELSWHFPKAVLFIFPRNWNLLNQNDIVKFFSKKTPEYVFNCSGHNGGISFQVNAADIFAQNTIMNLNLLDVCSKAKIKKVVNVVASCAFPANQWINTEQGWFPESRETCPEHEFFDGEPHPSVLAHAYAKRNLQLSCQFYKQQYGLNAVCACPTTLMGPGDSFDPEKTKVVGALVKKFVDAAKRGDKEVTLWGTGAPLREFLYVEDAAKLLIRVMERYDDSALPINLGSGNEVSIMELSLLTARLAGFAGQIKWDTSKPDGQFRKRLDLTKMKRVLGDFEATPLEEGLAKTIEYYRATSALTELGY